MVSFIYEDLVKFLSNNKEGVDALTTILSTEAPTYRQPDFLILTSTAILTSATVKSMYGEAKGYCLEFQPDFEKLRILLNVDSTTIAQWDKATTERLTWLEERIKEHQDTMAFGVLNVIKKGTVVTDDILTNIFNILVLPTTSIGDDEVGKEIQATKEFFICPILPIVAVSQESSVSYKSFSADEVFNKKFKEVIPNPKWTYLKVRRQNSYNTIPVLVVDEETVEKLVWVYQELFGFLKRLKEQLSQELPSFLKEFMAQQIMKTIQGGVEE